jgi:hypothetical protein
MNEFEWLRQMRDENENAAPVQVTAPTPIRRERHRHTWALAAGFAAVALLSGGVVWRMHAIPASPQPGPITAQSSAPWKPSDPRLAGAALELGAARMELQQAMQQAPDSPALQRLLQRTDAQQARLRELEKQAG